VYAFAPYSPNLIRLRRNVAFNRFKNCVIVPTAVGRTDEPVAFREGKVPGDGLLRVPCTRLDSYIEQQSALDIIKMDIEGAEWWVLHGSRELFRSKRPIVFLATDGQQVHGRCCSFLEENCYALHFLAGDEFIARPVGSSIHAG
jgi:FkbM family methyltransferase